MFFKHLEIFNYRNYESCNIDFESNKTIIIGNNAQGKTNLLESVYYLANLSSFRANSDKELIQKGKDFTRIRGVLNKHDTDVDLDVWINPPKKKILKVNGIKKTKYSEFLENLNVVSFGVDDLLLLRGAPDDRRKWLDNAINQIYPAYADRMSKFNRIKTQRNNLLKSFNSNIHISETQKITLDIWDEQFVVSGANIVFLRLKYLKEISEMAKNKHFSISSEKEKLLFNYNSTVFGEYDFSSEFYSVDKIAELLKEKLKDKLNEDVIRGQSTVGPHRDDIVFYINDFHAVSFASQGQQRTVVLSLKLAELDLIKQKTGEMPVLLLDDVLAELDGTRQNYLLESIGDNIQTIITSTDVNNYKQEFLKDVVILKIEQGEIVNFNRND